MSRRKPAPCLWGKPTLLLLALLLRLLRLLEVAATRLVDLTRTELSELDQRRLRLRDLRTCRRRNRRGRKGHRNHPEAREQSNTTDFHVTPFQFADLRVSGGGWLNPLDAWLTALAHGDPQSL